MYIAFENCICYNASRQEVRLYPSGTQSESPRVATSGAFFRLVVTVVSV